MTTTADLYSLGQLIGWARTGRMPRKGSQLLPDDEPWRSIVEAATRKDPLARPQSAREFAEILKSELARG